LATIVALWSLVYFADCMGVMANANG
jgi:hypothetical protein